jgi:deoxyribonuclease-4
MLKNPIGAHYSIKDGYLSAFKLALIDGADALQIFAKSPASAKLRAVTKEEAKEVSELEGRDKIKSLVIHGSYLINLAQKELGADSYQIKSLAEDMRNAEALGGDGAIVHMGKALGQDNELAINNFVKNIHTLLKATEGVTAKIMIENTAGQGTEMGHDIKELGEIYKQIGNTKRVKICLDTAHAFGAGYDIAKDTEAVVAEIDKLIGVKNIGCIHLNDSKKPLNSRVDRHADIGAGEIGSNGLVEFAKALEKAGGEHIPLILEVPQESADYKSQIEKLRKSK